MAAHFLVARKLITMFIAEPLSNLCKFCTEKEKKTRTIETKKIETKKIETRRRRIQLKNFLFLSVLVAMFIAQRFFKEQGTRKR